MKSLINRPFTIGIFFIPIFLLSCNSSGNFEEHKRLEFANSSGNLQEEDQNSYAANHSYKLKEKNSTKENKQKKLIKKGTLALKSKHLEKSKARLDQALKSLDGYYDKEVFKKSNYEFHYSLKIRVPAKNFDRILEAIHGGSDEIISKNIQTDDVSGEYMDLETRLKSKRAYLKRYEELLTKAKNMDELLQIENQIRLLMEEIESQESRLNYLDDQVGYSTLDVELYKTIPNPVASSPGFSDNAQTSLSKGWIGVVTFVLWILSIWPLFLILIPAGIITFRKFKKLKK